MPPATAPLQFAGGLLDVLGGAVAWGADALERYRAGRPAAEAFALPAVGDPQSAIRHTAAGGGGSPAGRLPVKGPRSKLKPKGRFGGSAASGAEGELEGSADAVPVKGKRAPTEYNLYMRDEMPRFKQEHPAATHVEAFTEVAKQVHARTVTP